MNRGTTSCPRLVAFCIARMIGLNRSIWPTISVLPVRSAISLIARAFSTSCARAFDQARHAGLEQRFRPLCGETSSAPATLTRVHTGRDQGRSHPETLSLKLAAISRAGRWHPPPTSASGHPGINTGVMLTHPATPTTPQRIVRPAKRSVVDRGRSLRAVSWPNGS